MGVQSKKQVRILLPQQFDGDGIYSVTNQYINGHRSFGGLVETIIVDFQNLNFIRTAGIVFLRNFIQFLERKEIIVEFENFDPTRRAIEFLDDAQFFKLHTGSCLRANASVRRTTIPLKEISDTQIHAWLDLHFMPWLQSSTGHSKATLSAFKTMIQEIFNNISDHSRENQGNFAAQFHPNEHSVLIVMADWGVGIPNRVKEQNPSIQSDAEAILAATREGFSTKSRPNNRGAGLPLVIDYMVKQNRGCVKIRSHDGIVDFYENNGKVECRVGSVGFCPGTMFEIQVDKRLIVPMDEDSGDLEW